MPDPTAPDYIDRASALIREAAAAHSEQEQFRLLQGAEFWLQLAKRQLIAAKARLETDSPER